MVPSIILSFEEMVQNNGWPKKIDTYRILNFFFVMKLRGVLQTLMEDRENDYIQFS